ncbi:MAG: type II secretion system F family protein [Candidatus Marinimicrobia bacterium]|nr:type II secretion system F family protein [Candidatus Neomarinimicrobiota bacterium]
MNAYAYTAYDREGRRRSGLLEAGSLKEARERLTARGLLPKDVRPAAGGRPAGRACPPELRVALYRELAAMTQAGVPLVEALTLALDAGEFQPVAVGLAGLRDRIRQGDSLAVALETVPLGAGPDEVAALEAAAAVGQTPRVLERLADLLDERRAIREKVAAALFYPVLVLGAALIVAVLMFGFMLPRFNAQLMEAGVPIPPITRLVLGGGRVLLVLLALVVGGLVIGLPLARRSRRRRPAWQIAWDRRLYHLPVWGRARVALVGLRFARTLSLLLEGGLNAVQALRHAGAAVGSPWVAQQLAAETEAVRQGADLADALQRVSPFGETLSGWVRAGQAAGELPRLLEQAACRFQQTWERRLARALGLLEPLLLLFVGGIVLLVALAILLPILALNQQLI